MVSEQPVFTRFGKLDDSVQRHRERRVEIEGLREIVQRVVEQEGRGDYLEMGDRCIYCTWTGPSHATIIHDENCLIIKASDLLERIESKQERG
jgi:hypothetical protein